MTRSLDRRCLLSSAAAGGAVTVVSPHVLGGPGRVAPSDKITLAQIGFGTQCVREVGGLLADPKVQIVAVCDPNTQTWDYIEWGKGSILRRVRSYLGDNGWGGSRTGCPGGREVGKQVVDGYYARQRKADTFAGCAAYADFREMLAKVKDLDAVKILTPDHLHATLAIAAMNAGAHVAMHKPIANRLAEGRRVVETAGRTKRVTHLLAYGAGRGNAAIVESVKQGAIGTLREVHNWTNRPVWPQYTHAPTDRPPVPKGFDWSLWLGPVPDRPYHPTYTHTVYRGWYEFGGGSMADMGYYSLWPVFAGLDLPSPMAAEAWGTHTCAIHGTVSRPVRNDVAYPAACTIRLRFALAGKDRSLELFWYDGGMKPRLPEALERQGAVMGKEGILFVGDEGAILAGFLGQSPKRYAKGKAEPLAAKPPAKSGHGHGSWVEAMRRGEPSAGSFLHARAITDAVNLGTAALRTGKKLTFDAKTARITNAASANKLLTRTYRKGWEL